MKILYLSVIIGSGITVAVTIGIFLMIFSNAIFSTESTPSCILAPNVSREKIILKQITWMSVMEIEKNQTKLDCTSVNSETFSTLSKLGQALYGADQCKQGIDNICSFPSGIRMTMVSDRIMPVDEGVNYQASLTQDEANALLDNVRLVSNGNLIVGDVEYNNKYYQIILQTSDKPPGLQVNTHYTPEPNYIPYDLEIGKSTNYTITVKTLATFGNTTKVQLYPIIPAQDSGLVAKIVPDMLFIPERSEANATMIITAGPNVQNGIYQIGFGGKISDGGFAGGMRQDPCPCIRIGDSDWTIRTYDGNGGSWGGNQSLPWLRVETVTDKQLYHTGETVEIKNFIINDSPNKITLENGMRMFVVVYNQVNGTGAYRYFYGIDALYDGKPISLEPHSKTIIARPFYWDQSDLRDQSVSRKVIPGNYIVDVSFGSYNGTVWDNDVPIVIK
jgi:hypothetical protein